LVWQSAQEGSNEAKCGEGGYFQKIIPGSAKDKRLFGKQKRTSLKFSKNLACISQIAVRKGKVCLGCYRPEVNWLAANKSLWAVLFRTCWGFSHRIKNGSFPAIFTLFSVT